MVAGRHWLLRVLLCHALGCGRVGFAPAESTPDTTPVDSTPWSLVQVRAASSATVPIQASGADHLIVVAIQTGQAGIVTAVTDDGLNTYTPISAARATNNNPVDGLELWYASTSRPNASTVTVGATTGVVATVVWEVAGITSPMPLDTATKIDNQPATNIALGPSITTAAPGEFVVSVVIVANGVSATHPGNEFNNDARTRGNGWAHLADATAPAGPKQAQWDQNTAGTYCANAAAFR